MAAVVKAEVEAAFKLLKENGFKGVPDEAANGGETINRLLSIIEAQSRQIMQLTTQLTELLLRDNNRSTKN